MTLKDAIQIILDGGPAVVAVLLLMACCVLWRSREKLAARVEELHEQNAKNEHEHYQEAISFTKTMADLQARTNQVISALTAAIGG